MAPRRPPSRIEFGPALEVRLDRVAEILGKETASTRRMCATEDSWAPAS
jgi:hypothetical protein